MRPYEPIAPLGHFFSGESAIQVRVEECVAETQQAVNTSTCTVRRAVLSQLQRGRPDFWEPLAKLVEQPGAPRHRIVEDTVDPFRSRLPYDQDFQVLGLHVQDLCRTGAQRFEQ